jgi:hypothetical protein
VSDDQVLDLKTDKCPRCKHPLKIHSVAGIRTGKRQVYACCATVYVYYPTTDVLDYSHPCECPGPKGVRV